MICPHERQLTGYGTSSHIQLNKGWRSTQAIGLGFRTDLNVLVHEGFLVPCSCSLDTFFKAHLGGVAQHSFCFGDVGTCVWNITGLVGHNLDESLASSVLLDQINEFLQRCSTSLSQVEDLVGVGAINGTDNTIDDITDVSVISGTGTISKLLQLHTTTDTVNKLEWGHIRATTGSIDSKESQASDIELGEMMVGVGQQLAGLLGGSIG